MWRQIRGLVVVGGENNSEGWGSEGSGDGGNGDGGGGEMGGGYSSEMETVAEEGKQNQY